MSAVDRIQKEVEDIELKLGNARKAAAAPDASAKDKADLKLIEQDLVAARQKARHVQEGGAKPKEQPTDPKKKLDKKLDDALKDSFPTSDPIAVAQPTAVQEQDRSLPEVKMSEQQYPEKTKAARKSG